MQDFFHQQYLFPPFLPGIPDVTLPRWKFSNFRRGVICSYPSTSIHLLGGSWETQQGWWPRQKQMTCLTKRPFSSTVYFHLVKPLHWSIGQWMKHHPSAFVGTTFSIFTMTFSFILDGLRDEIHKDTAHGQDVHVILESPGWSLVWWSWLPKRWKWQLLVMAGQPTPLVSLNKAGY